MDINDLRVVIMVLAVICFLAITAWAYSGRAKKGFDEAALLPFSDDDLPVAPSGRPHKEGK